jgi:hypothetical protein
VSAGDCARALTGSVAAVSAAQNTAMRITPHQPVEIPVSP